MSGNIYKDTGIRNPLGRARGLGSAKEGFHHWWMQRVTAVAMIPLFVYLVSQAAVLAGGDYTAITVWLDRPVNAVAMLLFIVSSFYHAALGIQVIVEDYIHGEGVKITALLLNKLFFLFMAVAAIYAVLAVNFSISG